MLVRAIRLTDKFGNALLRIAIWLGEVLLLQLYRLRTAFADLLGLVWFAGTQLRAGRIALETNLERRRQIMARRAAEVATRTVVREDPLKTQNRALSIFTMVLMLTLIGLIVWFTSNAPRQENTPKGGVPIVLATTPAPTLTPTINPTATLSTQAYLAGSVVYSQRENGQDQLWAFTIGKGAPVRLTNVGDNRNPVWSPDSTKIAFQSNRDGNWELYVLDLTTGQSRRLTTSLFYKGAPTWSPDGKFLAYESYEGDNLNIWIAPTDGSSQPQQLTFNPAPDFSPAWFPAGLGRKIAYVSLRDGNDEIYVIDLNSASEVGAQRVTNTPTIDEDHPVWSPDGTMIAYSGRVAGQDNVFVKVVDDVNAEPRLIGRGIEPTWSPDSSTVIFVQYVPDVGVPLLVSVPVRNTGIAAIAANPTGKTHHPSWTRQELPPALIASGGLAAPQTPPLCVDTSDPAQPEPPIYSLRQISGVVIPNGATLLSDRVDESFNSLRQLVQQRTGYDFLGQLSDMYWDPSRIPEPGQSRNNWQYTGRAFSFDRNLIYNVPSPIEIMREDLDTGTYWRIYIRVAPNAQQGQLGEPLKQRPWDFTARSSGDAEAFEQGGLLKPAVPSGYYVDFTDLADDCGWERVPSEKQWRSNFSSLLYWQFEKRDGLTWEQAMLEVMSRADFQAFLNGPTPVPTRREQATNTPLPRRSATPVPPA